MTWNNKSKHLCWTESLCICLCWYYNTTEFQPSNFIIKFPKVAIGQNSYLTWAFWLFSSVNESVATYTENEWKNKRQTNKQRSSRDIHGPSEKLQDAQGRPTPWTKNYELLKGDPHHVINNVTRWQFECVHLLGRTTTSQYKTSFDQSWHGWPGSVEWTWIWLSERRVTKRMRQQLHLWLCQVSCTNISEVWSVKQIQGPYSIWQLLPVTSAHHYGCEHVGCLLRGLH